MQNSKQEVNYVVGFAFDQDRLKVALIEKRRPKWQAGKLNGIGGHIEAGETPAFAMSREFWEETGFRQPEDQWVKFCEMHFDAPEVHGIIHCFHTELKEWKLKTMTDEKIVIRPVHELGGAIRNLRWLIPMAKQQETESVIVHLK